MKYFDFCKFINDIKIDPKAMVPRLKIWQFLALQNHVKQCLKCSKTVEEVLNNNKVKKQPFKDLMGEN